MHQLLACLLCVGHLLRLVLDKRPCHHILTLLAPLQPTHPAYLTIMGDIHQVRRGRSQIYHLLYPLIETLVSISMQQCVLHNMYFSKEQCHPTLDLYIHKPLGPMLGLIRSVLDLMMELGPFLAKQENMLNLFIKINGIIYFTVHAVIKMKYNIY